jgi:hypothetical protein
MAADWLNLAPICDFVNISGCLEPMACNEGRERIAECEAQIAQPEQAARQPELQRRVAQTFERPEMFFPIEHADAACLSNTRQIRHEPCMPSRAGIACQRGELRWDSIFGGDEVDVKLSEKDSASDRLTGPDLIQSATAIMFAIHNYRI